MDRIPALKVIPYPFLRLAAYSCENSCHLQEVTKKKELYIEITQRPQLLPPLQRWWANYFFAFIALLLINPTETLFAFRLPKI